MKELNRLEQKIGSGLSLPPSPSLPPSGDLPSTLPSSSPSFLSSRMRASPEVNRGQYRSSNVSPAVTRAPEARSHA